MRWSLRSMNSFLLNPKVSLNQLAKGSNLVFLPLSRNMGVSQIADGAARASLIQVLAFISSKSNEVNKVSSNLVSDVDIPKLDVIGKGDAENGTPKKKKNGDFENI